MTRTFIAMGERIRARREHLRLKQTEVADELGMSSEGYGHWERGRSEPTASQLTDLARVLSVPVSWLLGEEREVEADERVVRFENEDDLTEEQKRDLHRIARMAADAAREAAGRAFIESVRPKSRETRM